MMQPSFRLFLVFLPVLQTQAIQLLNFTKNRCDNRLRAGWLVAQRVDDTDGGRTLSDTSQTILDDLGPVVVVVVEMRAGMCPAGLLPTGIPRIVSQSNPDPVQEERAPAAEAVQRCRDGDK